MRDTGITKINKIMVLAFKKQTVGEERDSYTFLL